MDIMHVVVLMLENRSFDSMLGMLYPSSDSFDGLTGTEQNTWHAPDGTPSEPIAVWKSPVLTPDEEYKKRVRPFLAARGITNIDETKLQKALSMVRERATTFVEAADKLDFFFRDAPVMDEKAVAKFLVPAAAPSLEGLAGAIRDAGDWSAKVLEERVNAWLAGKGLQIKDIAQPARVALTGRTASPGLFEVLEVLGRQDSLARLDKGRALALASTVT